MCQALCRDLVERGQLWRDRVFDRSKVFEEEAQSSRGLVTFDAVE